MSAALETTSLRPPENSMCFGNRCFNRWQRWKFLKHTFFWDTLYTVNCKNNLSILISIFFRIILSITIFSELPYRYWYFSELPYRYWYFSELPYQYRYFSELPYQYLYIDIFKNDHIDIDIKIFQKCRYINNRYFILIYRTPLPRRPKHHQLMFFSEMTDLPVVHTTCYIHPLASFIFEDSI